MEDKSLAPQQERSRQTLECLLAATLRVLDKHGLESATIPRIAEAAKVAPASVYRRFADKDALIREALLSVLENSSKSVQATISPQTFAKKSIEDGAKTLIRSIFLQYRQHPMLMTALKRFSEREGERELERKATEIFSRNLQCLVAALCACKDLKGVRQKEKKVQFALMTVVTAIEVMALEPTSLWNVVLTESDEQIQASLVKMLLAYIHA